MASEIAGDRPGAVALVGSEPGVSPWQHYAEEILEHWRLPFERGRATGRLLLFAAPPELSGDEVASLERRLREGACAVIVGGPGSLARLAGCTAGASRTEGHVLCAGGELLPAFGGVELRVGTARALARWSDGEAAATEAVIGRGLVVVIGADLWQTVVRIQQGWPVTGDGTPAADGSAPVDDGVLKTDDAIALSYEHDRSLPPGGTPAPRYEHRIPAEPTLVPIFDRPLADRWRRFLLHQLLRLARHTSTTLPWLHYWPAGVEAVAHFSNDSDGNEDAAAEAILDAWAESRIRGTWCYLYPGGLSPRVLRRVEGDGHEMALHYNAHDGGAACSWGFDQLRDQLAWLKGETGARQVPTNKNHYLRWEGWDEFYLWSEAVGIELDQSHGPSKQGNSGFPFGTAHLSFPLVDGGARRADVLAQPLHFQDLWFTSPEANREILIGEALAEHGVAHFLFHGRNVHNHPEVRRALLRTVGRVRERGLAIWTAAELNAWERARRGVDLQAVADRQGWTVTATSRRALAGAAILIPAPERGGRPHVTAGHGEAAMVDRHGLRHIELAADLVCGENVFRVEWAP